MSKVNVLVFPAGKNNSIELHNALSHNVNIEVFGTSSIERHGRYVFKNYTDRFKGERSCLSSKS